jgi:hypothetical protein
MATWYDHESLFGRSGPAKVDIRSTLPGFARPVVTQISVYLMDVRQLPFLVFIFDALFQGAKTLSLSPVYGCNTVK